MKYEHYTAVILVEIPVENEYFTELCIMQGPVQYDYYTVYI